MKPEPTYLAIYLTTTHQHTEWVVKPSSISVCFSGTTEPGRSARM